MMYKFFKILFLFCAVTVFHSQVYVSVTGSGNGSGTSWVNSSTLQNAITNAVPNSQLWLRRGTYNISQTLEVTYSQNNIRMYGGFVGNETNLNQRNYVANPTILDGQTTTQIMRINGSGFQADGLTFQNGYVTGTVTGGTNPNSGGGAIFIFAGDSVLRNCRFLNNVSTSERGAGAVYIRWGGNQLIENCVFQNNSHTVANINSNGGGAIHNWDEDVTIRNSQFINNSSSRNGGAIYTWGQNMIIEGCTFENNHTDASGGAIHINYYDLDISKSTFTSNTADQNGGAINNNHILSVTNSVFEENSSVQYGGAIYNDEELRVANILFEGNSATIFGGAVFNSRELYVSNSTFVSNQNTAVGYSRFESSQYINHITTIYNSIFFSNNSTSPKLKDVDVDYNNDLSTKDFRRNIFQENTYGTNNLVGVNPLFQNFASGNYRLQLASPGVNYGSNALYNSVSTTTAGASTDLGNNPRVFGSSIDLGAYELQQIVQPTVPNCTQLSSPANNSTNVSLTPNLTWTAVSNATGYLVYVGTSATNFNILNGQDVGNVTAYALTGLQQNTQYFVRIVPYNSVGNATGCTVTNFRTLTIPVVPNCTQLSSPANNSTNVSLTPNLTWTAVSNATGYLVYVGTSATNFNILNGQDVGNVTTYALTGLQQNTQYFVRIVPYNSVGNATGCTVTNFTTLTIPVVPNCTQLSSPVNNSTNVSLTPNLTWSAVSNATGYLVYVGTSATNFNILNGQDVGNVTTYALTGLQQNTQYFVRIVPYNSVGNATGCTVTNFTTLTIPTVPNCTQLSSPANNSTNVSLTPNLTWSAVSNATGYLVYVGTSATNFNILNGQDVGNVTTYALSGLQQNTQYFVRIVPYNSVGNATGCTVTNFTTLTIPVVPNCTQLSSPANNSTNVSLTPNLTWSAVSNATGYLVYVGTSATNFNILNGQDVGNVTTYALTGLQQNTQYFVRIVPYNSVGNATGCTVTNFTTLTIPTVPNCTQLSSPANNSTNISLTPNLTWTAVSNATGYLVYVGTSATNFNILNGQDVGNVTTYALSGLQQNTQYFVRIVPYNSVGNAAGCTVTNFTTIGCTNPLVLTVTIQSSFATITIQGGVSPYYYQLDGGNWQTTTGSTINFSNLSSGNHVVIVMSEDTCEATLQFSIINIPNVVTSNGDGYNDEIDLSHISSKTDPKFQIYDRHGNLLFEGNASNNFIWTGTRNNGSTLPSDSYWYILEWKEPSSEEIVKRSGWILLKLR